MKKILALFLLSLTTSTFAGRNEIDVPPIPPTSISVMCTTDLQDYDGNIVKSFTKNGNSILEACGRSEEFCSYVLQSRDSSGDRCVTSGSAKE